MDWTTCVAVHESASPESTRRRILAALRRGELDPSLLYGGLRQTTLWMQLHEAVSPARNDSAVLALYNDAFGETARSTRTNVIHLVSLACGSGSKDVKCLEALRTGSRAVLYTPADISLEMVLTAQQAATASLPGLQCTPLLCDLPRCSVLPAILKQFDPSAAERLILFLGTIHNYWPPEVLKSIVYSLRQQDQLLLGANLAPAEDYEPSLIRILGQYDNEPTRAWLTGALGQLGADDAGQIQFGIADAGDNSGLKRIEAQFTFNRGVEIHALGETVTFEAGTSLRVFYSYRFTPQRLRTFLADAGLKITREWLLPEEGLFLCRRANGAPRTG